MAKTPSAKFSLPGDGSPYARGDSREFRQTLRKVFGPLVEWVPALPAGQHAWLMIELQSEGSLAALFGDLEQRLTPSGSLWVVLPKKTFAAATGFPFSWADGQLAGLAAGLVDNKIAAFSPRLTSIRFVIPLSRRKAPATAREKR